MQINRTSIARLLLLFFICLATPEIPGQAADGQATLLIQSMLDQVDPGTVYHLSGDLSGEWPVAISGEQYTIESRYALSGEPIQKTTQYLNQYYLDLGLDVFLHEFQIGEQQLSNVIAEMKGTVFPERILMISSHFDDVDGTPGVDDDASGTVGVMIAASILSQYEFGCTLRFANFNAEEQGMIGSDHYAQRSYCAQEDIRGVINLDMIAWNSPGSPPEFNLHPVTTVPGSSEIATSFQEIVSTYGLNLIPTIGVPFISASDHASFLKRGFPAILASEDGKDFNPYYHHSGDSLDNLPGLEYYTEAVKASLGTLASMGCLVENGWGVIEGVVTDKLSKEPIPNAIISISNPDWGYSFHSSTDQEGYYQLPALEGWHNLSADGIGHSEAGYEGIFISHSEPTSLDIELDPAEELAIFLPLAVSGPSVPPLDCQ